MEKTTLVEVISQEKINFQKDLLFFMNTKLLGIQILAIEKNSIILSEFGGDLYLFNMFITGSPQNSYKKLEVHVRENKNFFLQLFHDHLGKNLAWWRDFSNVDELKENFSKELKEVLAA